MKKLFGIAGMAFLGLFISCQQGTKESSEEDTVVAEDPNAISCDGIGPVKFTHSLADLEETFGADNISQETNYVAGQSVNVTRVFPGEPEELVVYWDADGSISKIATTIPGSPYETKDGIRVGSTLQDLRDANNFMPITMTNLYATPDRQGSIEGFNGGDLEVNTPCLGGVLYVAKQRAVDVRVLDEIQPERTIQSSHKLFSMIDVEVVELSVSK